MAKRARPELDPIAKALRKAFIREVRVATGYEVNLVVINQQFTVGPTYQRKHEARWYGDMLAKAIAKIIEQEGQY